MKCFFIIVGGELIQRASEEAKDHPLFKDPAYKKRRDEIAAVSKNTKITDVSNSFSILCCP